MECTVLIFTYNRPHHLKRILNYYYQYGRDLAVLIADSSTAGNKILNREMVLSFREASFSYLDKYNPSTRPGLKILDALQHVNTEYCVVCADDDFITPNGIRESTEFLDNNPDFIAAFGRLETFLLEPAREGEPKFTYLKHNCRSNTCTEPKDRLVYGLGNYDGASFFYAVYHTDLMRVIYTEAMKSESIDFFIELLIVGLSAIYGKVKCLDTLFSVREICTPAHMTEIHPTILDIKKDKSYEENKQNFYDCLAVHLSKQAGIDRAESYKTIDEAMAFFTKTTTPLMFRISRKLTQLNLPSCLDHSIRKIYRAAVSPMRSSLDGEYSLTTGYDIDSDQIKQCILSSAKEVYGLEY